MIRFPLLVFFALVAAQAANEGKVPPAPALEAARVDFLRQDFRSAENRLAQIKTSGGEDATALSLLGAVYLEENKFDEARQMFQAARKADSGAMAPKIYLGEVLLREKKFADARAAFESAESDTNTPFYLDLLRYRILITHLAEHADYDAHRALVRITFPASTPAYHYAQAAWEFSHGKAEEAKKWLTTADRLFEASQIGLFARPLYDLGLIKTKPRPALLEY